MIDDTQLGERFRRAFHRRTVDKKSMELFDNDSSSDSDESDNSDEDLDKDFDEALDVDFAKTPEGTFPSDTGMDEEIGFKKLENKIKKEGKSDESAKKIAASIGRKKYGAKGMAEKAAAARK